MPPRVPQKAVRKGQKARVAFSGPAGAGKTWTALEAAHVLADGQPVLVIDTERGSASLYADMFDFETIDWVPPYDPRELADALEEHGTGYGCIVVDSLSHFWEGEGGTRDIVDAAAARSRGNSFAGWKEGTPAQNDMVNALLSAACHVIVTMRSKTEYVLEERNGKQVPRKVGMAPIQRAGIEFEFTVTADLDVEHTLIVDKTRCHALAGRMYRTGHTVEMAKTLHGWLETAEPLASPADVARIVAMFDQYDDEHFRSSRKREFVDRFGLPQQLTAAQVEDALGFFDEEPFEIDAGEAADREAAEGPPVPLASSPASPEDDPVGFPLTHDASGAPKHDGPPRPRRRAS